MQSFKKGEWPWHIRPGGGGSSRVKKTSATPMVLGTSYTPVAENFTGTPVPLSGRGITCPDGTWIDVSVSPVIVTANFNYAGTSTGYYSSGSYQLELVLYRDANPVMFFPCGNGGLIANPIFYVYSREGANDMANFTGKAFYMSGSANKVGINMTVFRCSVSVSLKVLSAWVE